MAKGEPASMAGFQKDGISSKQHHPGLPSHIQNGGLQNPSIMIMILSCVGSMKNVLFREPVTGCLDLIYM